MLDGALVSSRSDTIPGSVQQRLLASVARDVEELLPYLRERAQATAVKARERLGERGRREAEEMRAIIEAQRKRILETEAAADKFQQRLDFENAKRQLEADRRHWQHRLDAIDTELRVEPARIRDTYTVAVGIVYLWPTTG
jgi:hypothetical protein